MRGRRQMILAAGTSALALIVLVGGFVFLTGHKTRAKPTLQPSPSPSIHTVRHVLRSPFTGERIRKLGPELIFKIDNVIQARPPTGLAKADIVYLLPVE